MEFAVIAIVMQVSSCVATIVCCTISASINTVEKVNGILELL
jgi:hypothetical protein